MFEGTVKQFPSKISYKSFKTQNLAVQNSYCDHTNCVDQLLGLGLDLG